MAKARMSQAQSEHVGGAGTVVRATELYPSFDPAASTHSLFSVSVSAGEIGARRAQHAHQPAKAEHAVARYYATRYDFHAF